MIRGILQKMYSNIKMFSCLLIGVILAVAMMSSIPVYTDGVLQRMLTKDMENFQTSNNTFPGAYYFHKQFIDLKKPQAITKYNKINNEISKKLYPELPIPAITNYCNVSDDLLNAVEENEIAEGYNGDSVIVEGLTEFKKHIKIIKGKMFSTQKTGGVYEAVVSEETTKEKRLFLGGTYIMKNNYDETSVDSIKVKIVGVYTNKDANDPYWYQGDWEHTGSMIIDYDLFMNAFVKETPADLTDACWYYALDYHKIKVKQLTSLMDTIKSHTKIINNNYDYNSALPAFDILNNYIGRAKTLKMTLLVLQVPILLMILFYLFMVSQLIIDRERNEIAVLKSRGYSRGQIIKGYFAEGLILSGIALLVGPILGLLLCNFIGASNGFLEFVQRRSFPVSLNLRAYGYSLIAIVFFLITMLIPAIRATNTSIVNHKQKSSRKGTITLWKKFYLDIVLLAISLYGLYTYKSRLSIIKVTNANGSDIPMDPLLFCISTLFIIAIGMVFLRIYPYIIRLIFWIGRKFWGPVAFTSLTNVGRSGAQDQFLMLFLILTISMGIFNANSARTINSNIEQKVLYSNGADIVLKAKWQNNKEPTLPDGAAAAAASAEANSSETNSSDVPKPVIYIEPPFSPYANLKGVESTARVLREDNIDTSINGKFSQNTTLMAIDTYDFGKTAWFRNNLLPYHWYSYLNLMTKDQRALLVSTSYKKKYNAKVGDLVSIKWGDNVALEGYIFAFIDYWPTYNPYKNDKNLESPDLIVANLSYINAHMRSEPYEVWLKLKKDATTSMVYNDIKKKKLDIESIQNAKEQVTAKKNDPMLQGTNGVLTMGFIVTIIICTIGFLIYWILSFNKRTLQFGIFRAMGINLKEILKMIAIEQVLISGTSIVMGIIAGGLSSYIFIPLLQILSKASEQVPPFSVTASRGDYYKIYVMIIMMLVVGFSVLGRLISKIKINQALKLGED